MIWKGTSKPKKKLGLLNAISKRSSKPKKKLRSQKVISKRTRKKKISKSCKFSTSLSKEWSGFETGIVSSY